MLTPKEKYELEKAEKLKEKEQGGRVSHGRRWLKRIGITIVVVGLIGLGGWLLGKSGGSADPTAICIQHARLAMHIHPHIEIRIKGEVQEIPANIGVSPTCMRPLHTHDDTGVIHIEFPALHDATLGEFFHIWERPFNREQIFEFRNGPEGTVKMFVNGEPNEEFENYIVKDGDKIEIVYK